MSYAAQSFEQSVGPDGVLTVRLTGVKAPTGQMDTFPRPTTYTLTPALPGEAINGHEVAYWAAQPSRFVWAQQRMAMILDQEDRLGLVPVTDFDKVGSAGFKMDDEMQYLALTRKAA